MTVSVWWVVVLVVLVVVLFTRWAVARADAMRLKEANRNLSDEKWDATRKAASDSIQQMHDHLLESKRLEHERHRNRMEELKAQAPNAALEVGLVRVLRYDVENREVTLSLPTTTRATDVIGEFVKYRTDRMMWVSQP